MTSLRTTAYKHAILSFLAKGGSEEAVADWWSAFPRNPDIEDLRAALREYLPDEDFERLMAA